MRQRRINFSGLWGLLWAVCLGASGSAAEPAAKVKLATLAPKGSSFHHALQEMGEKWRQAPGGAVTLTLFTDGSMGGEVDMVRKMRIGQIQAAALTAVGLSEIEKSVSALQFMPMMFRSWEEVDYVLEKLAPTLEKKFADKGYVVLFWTYAGWVKFFSRQPAAHPDDYKKAKIFSWAGSREGFDLMRRLGYKPVALETADILPGLQTGLIDAVPTIPVYANAGQFYNQASHMLDMNWAPIVGGAVITKKVWDRISPAGQTALREAAAAAGRKIKEQSRKENDEAVEAMRKRGLKVQPLTPENEKAWRRVAEEIYPSIRENLVPADMFDAVQKLLREFRAAQSPAKP